MRWSLPLLFLFSCHGQYLSDQSFYARGLADVDEADDLDAMESIKQEKRLPLDGFQESASSVRRVVSAEAPVQYGIKPTSSHKKNQNLNPFSLFPPEFHPLLKIPVHIYENGSSYSLTDKYKYPQYRPTTEAGKNPIVMTNSYANTKIQGYAGSGEKIKKHHKKTSSKSEKKPDPKEYEDYMYVDNDHDLPNDQENTDYFTGLLIPGYGDKISKNTGFRRTTTRTPTTTPTTTYWPTTPRTTTSKPPLTSRFPDPETLKTTKDYQAIVRPKPITLSGSYGIIGENVDLTLVDKINTLKDSFAPTTYKPKPFKTPSFNLEDNESSRSDVIIADAYDPTTTVLPTTEESTTTFPAGYKQQSPDFYPLGPPTYDPPPEPVEAHLPFQPQQPQVLPNDIFGPIPGNTPISPILSSLPQSNHPLAELAAKLPFKNLDEIPPEVINNYLSDQRFPNQAFPPRFPLGPSPFPISGGRPLFRPEQLPPVRVLHRPPFIRPGLNRPGLRPFPLPPQVANERKEPENQPPPQFVNSNPGRFPFKPPFHIPKFEEVSKGGDEEVKDETKPGFPATGFVPYKPQWFPEEPKEQQPTLFPAAPSNKAQVVVNHPNPSEAFEPQIPNIQQSPPVFSIPEDVRFSASSKDQATSQPLAPLPHQVPEEETYLVDDNIAPPDDEEYLAYPPFDTEQQGPQQQQQPTGIPQQPQQQPIQPQQKPIQPQQRPRLPHTQKPLFAGNRPGQPGPPRPPGPLPPRFKQKTPGENLFNRPGQPPRPRPPFSRPGIPPHRIPRPTNVPTTTQSFDFFSWLTGK